MLKTEKNWDCHYKIMLAAKLENCGNLIVK